MKVEIGERREGRDKRELFFIATVVVLDSEDIT
jgi:hypothetical protein